MKPLLIFIIFIMSFLMILSSFLINIFPPNKKELLGVYKSTYESNYYYLEITKSGNVHFIVKNSNKIIYRDICRKYEIEKVEYKRLGEYRITFSDCEGMDFSAILDRKLNFDIDIGNNGIESKRIDPDENIFYTKILNKKNNFQNHIK